MAAIRAAQLGMKIACIDENAQLGGTCLRVGCIPSKALLESSERYVEAREAMADHGVVLETVGLDLERMMARKYAVVEALTDGIAKLFKKNGVTSIQGRARLLGDGKVAVISHGQETVLASEHVIIATGSRPASLRGVEEDDDRIGNSTTALSWNRVPEQLVVIGGGYIGLELGSVWRRLGSQVLVLEAMDRILPGLDAQIVRLAHRAFEQQGIEFRTGTLVESAVAVEDGCLIRVKGGESIHADRILVATGRVPNTGRLGLEEAGVSTDARGFIRVENGFRTSAPGVYALGDCIGGAMLAHKASHEGTACVETIAGRVAHVGYDRIPAVVYTHPEIAMIGQTEQQLKEGEVPYRKGFSPYGANGRARSLGDITGRVKILAHAHTDRILGVHMIGLRAGDLIAEAATAMAFGASSEDLIQVVHAHPTLSEIVHEAALALDGRALHS